MNEADVKSKDLVDKNIIRVNINKNDKLCKKPLCFPNIIFETTQYQKA